MQLIFYKLIRIVKTNNSPNDPKRKEKADIALQ